MGYEELMKSPGDVAVEGGYVPLQLRKKRITEAAVDATHDEVTVTQEVVDEPAVVETFAVDTTTDVGQLVLSLLGELEAAQVDPGPPLTLCLRGAYGRDDIVPLPAREAGKTQLVLTGEIKVDPDGRFDLYHSIFQFAWENPAVPPAPVFRCPVTAEPCDQISARNEYCARCPGCSAEFLREHGVEVSDGGGG